MNSRTILLCCIFVICISQYSTAVSVSLVLQDDVSIKNRTIVHSLKAFKEIKNVTVVDYFSNVKIEKPVSKENFLGKDMETVKIEVGNLQTGESKLVTYGIISGNGSALLGADIYYLEEEKHQLFPREIELDVKKEKIVEPLGEERDNALQTISLALLFIILISAVLYLKLKK